MEKLDTVNEDPRFQSYMSAEEDDRKIMNSIKSIYYEKGIEQEKLEIATTLLKDGMDIDNISRITGLSKEKIKDINI